MKNSVDWVVAGGRAGEIGHCTRCGEGLSIDLPQRVELALALMKAFTKVHAACKPGAYKEPSPTFLTWPTSRDTGISARKRRRR